MVNSHRWCSSKNGQWWLGRTAARAVSVAPSIGREQNPLDFQEHEDLCQAVTGAAGPRRPPLTNFDPPRSSGATPTPTPGGWNRPSQSGRRIV